MFIRTFFIDIFIPKILDANLYSYGYITEVYLGIYILHIMILFYNLLRNKYQKCHYDTIH